MSEPAVIQDHLERATGAFTKTSGTPTFEPNVDPSAANGIIRLQKACRLLAANHLVMSEQHYGAVVEQSFIAIEHSISSYLIECVGIDAQSLMDHDSPYDVGRRFLPLDPATVDEIKRLYRDRRTDHYYDSSISTAEQAEAMHELALSIHAAIANRDSVLRAKCTCDGNS